jgi:hypothetical protein
MIDYSLYPFGRGGMEFLELVEGVVDDHKRNGTTGYVTR